MIFEPEPRVSSHQAFYNMISQEDHVDVKFKEAVIQLLLLLLRLLLLYYN